MGKSTYIVAQFSNVLAVRGRPDSGASSTAVVPKLTITAPLEKSFRFVEPQCL